MTQRAARIARESDALTFEQAQSTLRNYEALFMHGDLPGILAGFAEDVVVRFADHPETRGKAALERFLRARFARQKGYRVQKTLKAVAGSMIINTFVGEWTDAITGRAMQWRGAEFITLSDDLCVEWEVMANMWESGSTPQPTFI